MRIIAFRPEYQLTVDPAQNRIFYQNFGQMRGATSLPHYREDWEAALAEVSPGFVILSDMQVVNGHGVGLLAEFQAVEQLIVQRGVTLVAEVHVPGLPTRRHTDAVTTSQAMPVEYFLDIWDATQFLDELQLRTGTAA
ncbi:hypothetical protein MUN81_05805 [Hymenobacter sp. 5317J-9]|uniref:hypothetical protein n=1 Tax=Hymenobacter sp. 5317J-9 TaxID=2932250 RepID=UPI001FD70CD7|nr:hypothetical protein [Hymenobacter sp. 5317J-9]UOQ99004.1 hypothetical protein MUN81_05805 [Hymenobacter sp. 5317J-9]